MLAALGALHAYTLYIYRSYHWWRSIQIAAFKLHSFPAFANAPYKQLNFRPGFAASSPLVVHLFSDLGLNRGMNLPTSLLPFELRIQVWTPVITPAQFESDTCSNFYP